ncbi:MAG: polysaccharide biosynthesis/export family protein, partial [Opitutaceae bacterium]|nr:polysaccharide biosynthesis/export family protein [Cytophagales bacterium]
MIQKLIFFLAICCLFLGSCSPQNLFKSKGIATVPDSLFTHYSTSFEHKIRVDDKLTISIWNHDDLSVGSTFGIYNSNEVYGKWVLVDKSGNTIVPAFGKMHVAGLTAGQLADSIAGMFARQIVNPIVTVKILNRQVTV